MSDFLSWLQGVSKFKNSSDTTSSLFWAEVQKAELSEDFATLATLYSKMYAQTNDDFFLARSAEANRISSNKRAMKRDLKKLDFESIANSLGNEYSSSLIREKIILSRDHSFLKVDVSDRVVLDGIGKLWEFESARASFNDYQNFIEVAKCSMDVLPENQIDAASEVMINPPPVLHSDSNKALKKRRPFRRIVLPGGPVTYANARCKVGSNSVFSNEIMYVDEYRNEYPQTADPKGDPWILGVSEESVLLTSPSTTPIKVTNGFWLGGAMMHEFGHFVNTHLVKIWYFKRHEMWGKAPVLVPTELPPVFKDFLRFLIGDGVDILEFNSGSEIVLEKVVTVPSKVFSPCNPRPSMARPLESVFVETLQFSRLRDELRHMSPFSTISIPSKALLSRAGYSRRTCLNSEQISEVAVKHGFQEISMSDFSAADQVNFWLRSEEVVGELASWLYLSHLSPATKIIGLTSEYEYLYWAELSNLNQLRERDLKVILGETTVSSHSSRGFSENTPHNNWSLSARGIRTLDRALD